MTNIKKTFYWFFALCLLGHGIAQAQLIGPYGSGSITVEVDSNGLLSDTGTYGTGSLSLSGAGTRMIWYPGKAAFRAGYVSGTEWDDANIGAYSTAFGEHTTASGGNSFAVGWDAVASGAGAVAAGNVVTAGGQSSTAMGGGSTASANYSTALGLNAVASAWYSVAIGNTVAATGANATALGGGTLASGIVSTATGYATTASGEGSFTTGEVTTASGKYSIAMGCTTTAQAYESLTFGQYNVGGGTTGSWVSTDPIFEIGDGADATHHADAMVVYKNGNGQVHGTFRCAPGGDLSMGSFTAGTAP